MLASFAEFFILISLPDFQLKLKGLGSHRGLMVKALVQNKHKYALTTTTNTGKSLNDIFFCNGHNKKTLNLFLVNSL